MSAQPIDPTEAEAEVEAEARDATLRAFWASLTPAQRADALAELPPEYRDSLLRTVASDVVRTAVAWHAAGYPILSTRHDGTKAPAQDWKLFQTKRADLALTLTWCEHADGLGVVTGAAGDLEMLEAEGRAVASGQLEAAVIEAAADLAAQDHPAGAALGAMGRAALLLGELEYDDVVAELVEGILAAHALGGAR
jgi:hypothetical protein